MANTTTHKSFLVLFAPEQSAPVTVDQIRVISAFGSDNTRSAREFFKRERLAGAYAKYGDGTLELVESAKNRDRFRNVRPALNPHDYVSMRLVQGNDQMWRILGRRASGECSHVGGPAAFLAGAKRNLSEQAALHNLLVAFDGETAARGPALVAAGQARLS